MQSTYFNLIRRYATWIACGVGIPLGLVSLRAEETTRTIDRDSRTNWLPNTSDQEAARAKPHPWLTDAPPALARLVDRGNVQMIVDQPTVDAARKTALTIFTFSWKYRTRFRIYELANDSDGKRQVRIVVKFFDVEFSVAHRILLSDRYRPTRPWESALLPHEFDHVAISTDPRMLEILPSLEDLQSTIIVSPDEGTKISDSWAHREIEKSVSKFQKAVEKLVQQYYVRLDEVSNNGLKSIQDRSKFFTELYSENDLLLLEFSYTREMIDRIHKIKLDSIKKHYSLP